MLLLSTYFKPFNESLEALFDCFITYFQQAIGFILHLLIDLPLPLVFSAIMYSVSSLIDEEF